MDVIGERLRFKRVTGWKVGLCYRNDMRGAVEFNEGKGVGDIEVWR